MSGRGCRGVLCRGGYLTPTPPLRAAHAGSASGSKRRRFYSCPIKHRGVKGAHLFPAHRALCARTYSERSSIGAVTFSSVAKNDPDHSGSSEFLTASIVLSPPSTARNLSGTTGAVVVSVKLQDRRKEDADAPTLGNWPERGWPTLKDLEKARGRYPDAMFPDAALEAAAPSWDTQDVIYEGSVIWKMERETT